MYALHMTENMKILKNRKQGCWCKWRLPEQAPTEVSVYVKEQKTSGKRRK